jgi:hypothetical protein
MMWASRCASRGRTSGIPSTSPEKERAQSAITDRDDALQGGTPIPHDHTPKPRRGEVVSVVSWSGRFDTTVSHTASKRTAR